MIVRLYPGTAGTNILIDWFRFRLILIGNDKRVSYVLTLSRNAL